MVRITRESYPCLWSLFALVSATMSQASLDQVANGTPAEVAEVEAELSTWTVPDLVVLAGVVDDEATFQSMLRRTIVAPFVSGILDRD